jgi:quercetin dioxygenase-like cupin family protein/DNA-binding CsgD family transcriptional regulator
MPARDSAGRASGKHNSLLALKVANQAQRPLTSQPALEGLNQANFGVIIFDRRGKMIFANEPACNLFTAADGLQEREGEVRTVAPSAQPMLRAAISAAVTPSVDDKNSIGNLFLVPRSGRMPIIAAAAPLITSATIDAAGILLLYDTECSTRVSPGLLQHLFALTDAESALCVSLFEGYSVREFAEGRGVTFNTARTLLARAFAKTGKQRQSELVKLLAALSNMQSLGAGFAAGMAVGPLGFGMRRGHSPNLRLDNLVQAGLERFPDLEALVTVGEYAPGGVNKRHAHLDCLEIIFVLQGAISTDIEGKGIQITSAGQVLCVHPDIVHQGRNASATDPAKLVIVKLKQKGSATTVSTR